MAEWPKSLVYDLPVSRPEMGFPHTRTVQVIPADLGVELYEALRLSIESVMGTDQAQLQAEYERRIEQIDAALVRYEREVGKPQAEQEDN